MWLHVDRVLIAHQIYEAQKLGQPRGNLSDLYPRWLGTRELLLHHRDPYSREVTLEIQAGYYRRPLDPSRPQDPIDQQAFAYPVYTAFLLAPSVGFSFHSVQIAFFWLLVTMTVASAVFWLRFVEWRTGLTTIATCIFLTLGSFAAVQGMKLQQLSLLVAFLLAAALMCLSARRFVGAGILLALTTIKPQLSAPLIAWLLLWAVFKWRERWKFAGAFITSLAVLVVGGAALLPGWLSEFYSALGAYRRYAPAGPLFEQILPRAAAIPLITLLAAAMIALCWRNRRSESADVRFICTTALVLAVTLLVIPMMPPYNQVLLLPAIFLLVRDWRELWAKGIAGKVLLASVVVPLGWSWASAIVLAAASFFTPAAQNFWQAPLWTNVVLPIPVVACLGQLTWRAAVLKPEA